LSFTTDKELSQLILERRKKRTILIKEGKDFDMFHDRDHFGFNKLTEVLEMIFSSYAELKEAGKINDKQIIVTLKGFNRIDFHIENLAQLYIKVTLIPESDEIHLSSHQVNELFEVLQSIIEIVYNKDWIFKLKTDEAKKIDEENLAREEIFSHVLQVERDPSYGITLELVKDCKDSLEQSRSFRTYTEFIAFLHDQMKSLPINSALKKTMLQFNYHTLDRFKTFIEGYLEVGELRTVMDSKHDKNGELANKILAWINLKKTEG
jgi:hypothetical protein